MTDPFGRRYNGHSMLNALNSCYKEKETKEPLSFTITQTYLSIKHFVAYT